MSGRQQLCCPSGSCSERIGIQHSANQHQPMDQGADGCLLRGIDDAGMGLAARREPKKVVVLGDDHAPGVPRMTQMRDVGGPDQTVIHDSQDIDTAVAQTPDDGIGNMLIRVEADFSHSGRQRRAWSTVRMPCAASLRRLRHRDPRRSARSRPDDQSSRPRRREPRQG